MTLVAPPNQNSLKLPIHEWIGPVVNSGWNRGSAEAKNIWEEPPGSRRAAFVCFVAYIQKPPCNWQPCSRLTLARRNGFPHTNGGNDPLAVSPPPNIRNETKRNETINIDHGIQEIEYV